MMVPLLLFVLLFVLFPPKNIGCIISHETVCVCVCLGAIHCGQNGVL
jgi:hypothetical protein